MVLAVRGATTVDVDNKSEIISRVIELVDTIYKDNNLHNYSVISIIFSVTDDLVSINPAAALRSNGGYSDVPLFCTQEPKSEGALKNAIRVLITWNSSSSTTGITSCYLHGAKILRPDLTKI